MAAHQKLTISIMAEEVDFVAMDEDTFGQYASTSTYFDLSMLTAIRIKVKGDAEFGLALEHYEEVEDNKFRKAYWKVNATDDWTEVVLRPGEESLDSASYNVPFDEVSTEIALFSLFIYSGTRLQIDEIVFEGLGIEDFAEIRQ